MTGPPPMPGPPQGPPLGPLPGPPIGPRPGPARGRAGLATLIVLASLLLVATGLFVTLFLNAGNEHADAVARLDDRRGERAEVDKQVEAAESARRRTEERNSGLKSANTAMSGCVKAMQHYLWDGVADTQRTAAASDVIARCK